MIDVDTEHVVTTVLSDSSTVARCQPWVGRHQSVDVAGCWIRPGERFSSFTG
jgi:hypothetical protein